jgi:branched-chain amino acid transport system permease protein
MSAVHDNPPTAMKPRNWLREIFLDWEKTQVVISLVLLGLLGLAPLFVSSPYYTGILVLTTIYLFIGISWNIVSGFAGQLLMAHIIFVACGAYTVIVLYNRFGLTPWIGILIAGIVASLLGYAVALITLRYGLKADYFALFTIALMVAMKTIFLKWEFIGGALGMGLSLSDPTLGKMIFHDKAPYLYIALTLATFGVFVQYMIYRSKMGKYFMAIREEESAAAALGVNTSLYKTIAVVISAALAGIGGGFYVMYVGFVDPPQIFDLGLNVEMILAGPIIGGLGSLAGPVLGALVNKPLSELLRGFLAEGRSGTNLIVYGSFLILAILFMPRGLTGVLQTLYLKVTRRFRQDDQGGM